METENNLINEIKEYFMVYITINTVNRHFYVGVHKTLNPKSFDGYLGCGVNINNPKSYKYSKTIFQLAVNKYGIDKFKRFPLKIFTTLEEALEEEKRIVTDKFIQRRDVYNMVPGGGYHESKITYQYDLDGNFIKKWNSVMIASLQNGVSNVSISRAILDKTMSAGYLWTDYEIEKLDISQFTIGHQNKKFVYLYNDKGEFIREFESKSLCAKYIDCLESDVYKSCKAGYMCKNHYVSEKYEKNFSIAKTMDFKQKTVHQYTLDGDYVTSYNFIKDGAKAVGIKNPSQITQSIKLGQQSGGFQWSFDKVDKMKKYTNISKPRKVGQYDNSGKCIKIYDSISKCVIDFPCCTKVLYGQRKTTKGYIFKFVDD